MKGSRKSLETHKVTLEEIKRQLDMLDIPLEYTSDMRDIRRLNCLLYFMRENNMSGTDVYASVREHYKSILRGPTNG